MLLKSTVSLTASKFIVSFMPIVMLPVITDVLSKDEFSKYSLALSALAIFMPLICLNVQTGQRVRVAEGENNKTQNEISILIMLISTLFTLVILGLLPISILDKFEKSELVIIALGAFATGIITSVETYYVLERQPVKLSFMIIGSNLVIWLGAYFLLFVAPNWWVKIMPLILVGTFSFCKVLLFKRNYLPFKDAIFQGKRLLKIGLNVLPLSSLSIAFLHFDKVLAAFVFDLNEIFIYMALSSAVAVLGFLLQGSSIGYEYICYHFYSKQQYLKNAFVATGFLSLFIFSSALFFIFHDGIISYMISKELNTHIAPIVLPLIFASFSRACLILLNPIIIIWQKGPIIAAVQAFVFFVFFFCGMLFAKDVSVVKYATIYSNAMIFMLIATIISLAIFSFHNYINLRSK